MESMKKIFNNDMLDLYVKMNMHMLDRKPHIKKYNKIRRLHQSVVNSMSKLLGNDNYIKSKIEILNNYIPNEINDYLVFDFDCMDKDDISVFGDLFIYKNHTNLTSITEEFIEQNKFRNDDKKKMLEAMNNSYVSLFKVISTDKSNGYVIYEDVFTKKQYQIIDKSLSILFDNKSDLYIYNRIINYDGIYFGTGISCKCDGNKKILDYIKKHKYHDTSDFVRCLEIYNICRKKKR